jgi:hypothetical protein
MFYQPNAVSNIGIQHLHQSLEFTSEVVSVHFSGFADDLLRKITHNLKQ